MSGVYVLHGPQFAADPQAFYADMRQRYGAIAPVEIAPDVTAHLVISYRAALDLLRDEQTWSKDVRRWQATLPPDSPVLGMLGWRPNALFADGPTHTRYRQVITDAFARVQPHHLRQLVQDLADQLIDTFAPAGRADLVGQYARLLPLHLFNRLYGLDDDRATELIDSLAQIVQSGDQADEGNRRFLAYMTDLVAAKQRRPGHDITSWILNHPNRLTEEEALHHAIVTLGAGQEPTTHLISNALSRMLSDDDYYATYSDGTLTPQQAINIVLRSEPPLANYGAHVARHDTRLHGHDIRAHTLVLISYAAAGSDPDGPGSNPASGTGAHLAWSAGPHQCPVREPAMLIATTAIEALAARCTDLQLEIPREQLPWRTGALHRALDNLPVRFTPTSPRRTERNTAWHSNPFTASVSTPPAPTCPVR
ncbi:cytochrome P450 [Streptomyces xiamenensis]|uniref:cytochrome P450 n=1 Tax=Streptomyces xiamenensis TaxID=408015 RepID=UPI0036EADDE8